MRWDVAVSTINNFFSSEIFYSEMTTWSIPSRSGRSCCRFPFRSSISTPTWPRTPAIKPITAKTYETNHKSDMCFCRCRRDALCGGLRQNLCGRGGETGPRHRVLLARIGDPSEPRSSSRVNRSVVSPRPTSAIRRWSSGRRSPIRASRSWPEPTVVTARSSWKTASARANRKPSFTYSYAVPSLKPALLQESVVMGDRLLLSGSNLTAVEAVSLHSRWGYEVSHEGEIYEQSAWRSWPVSPMRREQQRAYHAALFSTARLR